MAQAFRNLGAPPRASSLAPLDRSSFVPYYRQIADQIRSLINSKEISAGQPLWSEGDVAKRLGVSKMTVRQAFNALRTEGLLMVEKGKIPRAGLGHVVKNFQELRGFTEEMERRGVTAFSHLLGMNLILPDVETSRALKLQTGEQVYRIRRLRFADDQVVGVETTYLPAHLFPRLDQQDLEQKSLYHILETVYGVNLEFSEEVLQAVAAGGEETRLLKVKQGFPLFSMRRKVYSSGNQPVELTHSLFRSDRYSASVISYRKK
jgi:GntR family transcriptional regulator